MRLLDGGLHLRRDGVGDLADPLLRGLGGALEVRLRCVVLTLQAVRDGAGLALHFLDGAARHLGDSLLRLLDQIARMLERLARLVDQRLQQILRGLLRLRTDLVGPVPRLLISGGQLVARLLRDVECGLRLVLGEVPRLLGGLFRLLQGLLGLGQHRIDELRELLDALLDRALHLFRHRLDAGLRGLVRAVHRLGCAVHAALDGCERARKLRLDGAHQALVIALARGEHLFHLRDQIGDGLLHLVRNVRVGALRRGLGGLRLGLQLGDFGLRALGDLLRSLPVVGFGLVERFLQLAGQLLRDLEGLLAVLLRLLHGRDEVLELLDLGLVVVVELLRLVDLLLHLAGELLRLLRPFADLLLDLREGARQHAVAVVAGLRQHGLDLVDDLLDGVLHVLRDVGVRLLGGGVAGIAFLLCLVEGGLGRLRVGVGAVVVVLLRLLQGGLALLHHFLALGVRLLAVLLGLLRVLDELLDLLDVGLVVVVELLRLVELLLGGFGELLRLVDDLADELLDFLDGPHEHAFVLLGRAAAGRGL